MNHKLWEAYLSLCRKVESGGRNHDGQEDPAVLDQQRGFVREFARWLPPIHPSGRPARILAPGAISEALLLAEAGYEVHAVVLGPDNIKWLEDRRSRLPHPDHLRPVEQDGHDLRRFPDGFFDGYFTVQVNEHWIAPLVHIGEVRFVMAPDAVLFVDACGTTNDACKMIWHTNLVPEKTVLEQWEFWGFYAIWRGSHGDQRPQFVLKMQPWDHPSFKNSGYLRWVQRLRAGEQIGYDYHCAECGK